MLLPKMREGLLLHENSAALCLQGHHLPQITGGMEVGDGCVWEKAVISLSQTCQTPSLEQVAVTRAKDLQHLAFLDSPDAPLTLGKLLKIGQGPAHVKCHEFVARLHELEQQSHPHVLGKIAGFDSWVKAILVAMN